MSVVYNKSTPLQMLLSEMEILFAQLIMGQAATEQRQIDVALSFLLNGKQSSSNSHL